ncbi:MAG: family 1 glycosylhydrolase [Faecalibacterium sp.]|jgi:beta-glucosidase|nr:family 1 glycosylhydrolase [Faecalibacterium sp.]
MAFPAGFSWGAASAAYQIEGGAAEGGRTPTIWDTFSHTPGHTCGGATGDLACDSYHRWNEDLDLLAQAGIPNYRFGIGWTRIFPTLDETPNPAGLAYYDAVVDGCLARGITPWITLYHWDLPQYLEQRGGWRSPETAKALGRMAGVVAKHFKGRVKHYFTINEPQCAAGLGYGNGVHAPGLKLSEEQLFLCVRNLVLAHGYAARAIRDADPEAEIGYVSTGKLCYPETEHKADVEAARKASFAIVSNSENSWWFNHNLYLDPVVLGAWPAECAGTVLAPLIDAIPAEELALAHEVPDCIGINVYNGHEVRAGKNGPELVPRYAGYPRTALKWPVTPGVMDYGLLYLQQRYQLPLYVSENGQSCNDRIFLDGQVHDPDRIDFLHRYLTALEKGIARGSGVKGYFHWSLTDNYEWASGYEDHFGLIYVDYRTMRRIPKDSYAWYRQVIATNGACL